MLWKELGDITILIVEDDPFNRLLIKSLLGKSSHVYFLEATDGLEALDILESNTVDIMLLDLHMPNMNGLQTLIELNKRKICATMAILAMTTDEVEKRSFYENGTDDFISKPFKLEELEKKIYENIVKKRQLLEDNTKENSFSKELISYTKEEIEVSQKDFFLKMVSVTTKSKSSKRNKAKVVASISKEFALKLGYDKTMCHHIYYASLIRDIGLIGFAMKDEDVILFTEENKKDLQKYLLLGYEMVSASLETDFINIAKTIILQYKESYDGLGMPYGIKKDEISDVAVIVAISETFEALLSRRNYRTPLEYSPEEAYTILVDSHMRFKPQLLEIFLKYFSDFVALRISLLQPKNT